MVLAQPVRGEERRGEAGALPTPPAVSLPGQRARRRILLTLLFVTLVKQLVLALAYPPFEGHDEVAHLGNLWTLTEFGRLPLLSDNIPPALEPYSRFTLDWPALYTAAHPPLYYLLAWPAYLLAGTDFLARLYALRLLAIPPFLLTIWLAHALAVELFPRDDYLALTVPAAVAFQPQLGFAGAIANNDALSICFGALVLYLGVMALRHGLTMPLALGLGFALGWGLLAKATLTAFVPLVAGVALWSRWPRPWARVRALGWWRETAALAVALAAPASLIPLPWYLFLRRTYGDFTAFREIDLVQASGNLPAGTYGELLGSRDFHLERLHEAWGYFGWKLLPLTEGELRAVEAGLLLCGLGLLVGVARSLIHLGPTGAIGATGAAGLAYLVAAVVLLYGAMIYFGTANWTQARYVFPAAPAAALLALWGLRALLPRPLLRPAAALTIAALAGYTLLLLTRLVLPYAFL